MNAWTEACGKLCREIRRKGYRPALEAEVGTPSCQDPGLMAPWATMVSNLLSEGPPARLTFPDNDGPTFLCGRCQDRLFILRTAKDGATYSRRCNPCLAWDRIYMAAEAKGARTTKGSISDPRPDESLEQAPDPMPRLGMFDGGPDA